MTEQAVVAAPAINQHDIAAAAMERVMILGDLSVLSVADRAAYYMRVCESVGLNPLTRPFEYIKLNNKLTLYAKRDCADQLRRLRGVNIKILDRKLSEGLLSIHVQATDKDGRIDEDYGVVAVGSLAGEALANLSMKAVTKAKRRVTLSICGLGLLDETEVVTIPGAELVEVDAAGEIKAAAPAMPLRKASAEGKRDGSVRRFNEIRKEIALSENSEQCEAVWLKHMETLQTMPRSWFDESLCPEFVDKMEGHGVSIDVDEAGWPIIERKQAAE